MRRVSNILILTLLGMMLLASLANAQEKSDRERNELKGTVRKIHTEYTFVEEDSGNYSESKRFFVQTVVYDNKGKKTKATPIYRCIYGKSDNPIYDEKGRMISEQFICSAEI